MIMDIACSGNKVFFVKMGKELALSLLFCKDAVWLLKGKLIRHDQGGCWCLIFYPISDLGTAFRYFIYHCNYSSWPLDSWWREESDTWCWEEVVLLINLGVLAHTICKPPQSVRLIYVSVTFTKLMTCNETGTVLYARALEKLGYYTCTQGFIKRCRKKQLACMLMAFSFQFPKFPATLIGY